MNADVLLEVPGSRSGSKLHHEVVAHLHPENHVVVKKYSSFNTGADCGRECESGDRVLVEVRVHRLFDRESSDHWKVDVVVVDLASVLGELGVQWREGRPPVRLAR